MITPTNTRLSINGPFFQLNGQTIHRGYGGLKSEVQNFKDALTADVKFFDGAVAYKDGPKVREALAEKDVKHVILSSKIPGFKLDPNDLKGSTERCFNEIMTGLGVDTLDILYLHGPDCIHKDVLDVLVALKDQGKLQYIGLSNVNEATVEALVNAGYPIGVVQNEFNPYFFDEDVLNYCHSKGIAVVGYRPFGDSAAEKMFEDEVLKNIAFRVQSTVQAVILQWINQRGVTPIPHSNNAERIKNNAMVPNWSLTEEEKEQIDSIKATKASTCNWGKFLHKELYPKSTAWIEELQLAQKK